jgi:hypothetical protein
VAAVFDDEAAVDPSRSVWLTRRHGRDRHPEAAEPPAAARQVHVLPARARRPVHVHEPHHVDGQRRPVRPLRDIDGEVCGVDAEAMTAEAMHSIQPYGSLSDGPGGKASGHLGRPPRRIPCVNMHRVCVAVNGPVNIRRATTPKFWPTRIQTIARRLYASPRWRCSYVQN